MNILDLISMVFIFVLVGYVGYRSSKNIKNIEDFTLAGSKLGKVQVGFSMAATELGGSSLIGAMAFCYTVGIAGAWWDWCAVPALVILGIFFAGKIKLNEMVTITDFFEKRYDRKTKILASTMHLLAITTQLATQFMVGAVALNVILGVPKNVGVLLTVAFVMAYTIGGGLIAVVNTDVVQFIVIVISVCISLPISMSHVGGMAGLKAALPESFFQFSSIDKSTVISWCFLCFFTYSTSQHYIQRIFASKDKATARFSFVFTGGVYFVYGIVVAMLGLCIAVLLPNLQDPNMGYALLIKEFMPAGVAGLILGGIFAASMSTADSMILAATTLFVNDIYNPIFKNENTNELKIIRIMTVVICIFSLTVSMFMDNIINVMYLGGLFYSTAVFYPLIIGLYNKRVNTFGALASMGSSVCVGLYAEIFMKGTPILGIPSNILASTVGLIVLIGVSLITPKPNIEDLDFLIAK